MKKLFLIFQNIYKGCKTFGDCWLGEIGLSWSTIRITHLNFNNSSFFNKLKTIVNSKLTLNMQNRVDFLKYRSCFIYF